MRCLTNREDAEELIWYEEEEEECLAFICDILAMMPSRQIMNKPDLMGVSQFFEF